MQGVLSGDRIALARAITLIESTLSADRREAKELLAELAPHARSAIRVGITGLPGAGKSTLIDAIGSRLTARGRRVGVLAVDPSSTLSGGSILGDKTRMSRLVADTNAFVRPAPSGGLLGGVTESTPQVITLLEAAGYDVVLIETVGVGQSESAVHAAVDCLCVLTFAGGGDELQAAKRGLLELADVIAVNKADGDGERPARLAAAAIGRALKLFSPVSSAGHTQVVVTSAITGAGLDELWDQIVQRREHMRASGELAERRCKGRLAWMRLLLERRLIENFESQPGITRRRKHLEQQVRTGDLTPEAAVNQLLPHWGG